MFFVIFFWISVFIKIGFFSGKIDFISAKISDVVIDMLKPIQDEYKHLISNKDYLNEVLKDGSERAFYIARKTMTKVKRKVGFIL